MNIIKKSLYQIKRPWVAYKAKAPMAAFITGRLITMLVLLFLLGFSLFGLDTVSHLPFDTYLISTYKEGAMSQITLRLPDDLHTKVRVLAAFKNVSQNDLLIHAAQSLVGSWEEKYGPLPMPPEGSD